MSIDPVKIPQNVHIEDKVVGPLTLRQMIIIMAGGGFSYILYATIQKTYGSVSVPLTVLAWIPAAIAAAFALVRVNDLSLTRICFLLMERMQKPTVRTWAPRRGISINIRVGAKEEQAAKAKTPHAVPKKDEDRIEELSSVVDQALPAVEAQEVTQVPTRAGGQESMDTEDISPRIQAKRAPTQPVDPRRIQADGKPIEPESPDLSDLSVFRDIFPSKP